MADYPWGGSEELWVSLANEALYKGDNVSASVYDWKETPVKIKESQIKGLNLFKRDRISYLSILGKIKGKIIQKSIAKIQLHSFIKKSKPDFLLVSMGAFCDIEIDPLRYFLKEIKVPYSFIVHVNTERYIINPSKIEDFRIVIENAKCVFFVSKRIRQQAERQLIYDFKNSDIVVNPVNMDEKGILPYLNNSTINFACVGRLQVDVKGQALLIQVLSSEKWKKRDWVLNIFGTGPDELIIQDLIEFYGLQEKVFLKGFVNNIRKEIWNSNHILLMPSYYEGLPIALIEAMLSGRSAIVTDVGGNSEIIKDGITGFIAEAASPNSIDKALETAWLKRDEWKSYGELAYKDAIEYFGENPERNFLKKIEKMVFNN